MTRRNPYLRAPVPYFGGKSRVARAAWARLGDPPNYIEPFFGSGAMLLARPGWPWAQRRTETVNDANSFIANFWRAVHFDPDATAAAADWPVNEVDLYARHRWLMEHAPDEERLREDPSYFDPLVAGWWAWGLAQWIGSGWCDARAMRRNGEPPRKFPHISGTGMGVHRTLPPRKRPCISGSGRGVHRCVPDAAESRPAWLREWFGALSARLRDVRVCCGDWRRVLGPSPLTAGVPAAVFLDPPYDLDARNPTLYAHDSAAVWPAVCAWCEEHGSDPRLRIALCGYADTWSPPAGWTELRWTAAGGYGGQGDGRGRTNRRRERIWFSPACLPARRQTRLFEEETT